MSSVGMLYGGDFGREPTHAELEALLRTRRVCERCDRDHADAADAGCTNGCCQCWCRG